MPPGLLVKPTLTMLTSTRINWDEATGITCVDMVKAPVGLLALETSCRVVDPTMPILEEVPRVRVLLSQMSPIYERQMTTLNKTIYSILT